MSTRSPRLYDIKRGMNRVPQYQDAAWAVKYTFGFEAWALIPKRTFPNTAKHSSFHRAKSIFEANVGYKVSNDKFYQLVRVAKLKGLVK